MKVNAAPIVRQGDTIYGFDEAGVESVFKIAGIMDGRVFGHRELSMDKYDEELSVITGVIYRTRDRRHVQARGLLPNPPRQLP